MLAARGARRAPAALAALALATAAPARAQDAPKPNVLIVLDTSSSMQQPPFNSALLVGGDDPGAALHAVKRAVDATLVRYAAAFNFGFATYNLRNSQKLLTDRPLVYVTRDDQPGASIWTGGTSYFAVSPLGSPYLFTGAATPGEDAQVWRSFGSVQASYAGPGCAAATPCRLALDSRLYREGLKFKWSTTATQAAGQPAGVGSADILLGITSIDCAAFPPPVGLFPDDPPGLVRPCLQHENNGVGAGLRTTTFWYSGARWTPASAEICAGAAVLDNVAACSVDNVPRIRRHLRLELPLWDASAPMAETNTCDGPRGRPCALIPATPGTSASPLASTHPIAAAGLDPDVFGVEAAQHTPQGAALEDIYAAFDTVFPNPGGLPGEEQRNVVILITDGPETCGTNPVVWASNLWQRNGHAGGRWAETIVVGLGLLAGDEALLAAVACAGSGGSLSDCTATTCACAGGLRRRAYATRDEATLARALQSVLEPLVAPHSCPAGAE